MVGPAKYNRRNMEEVFQEFKGRRAGLIKALTTDEEEFYQMCDPENENMCLYGFPNGKWEANVPFQEVPPEFPEPSLGINFARDGMLRKHWLALVAAHSDAWLVSISFFLSARYAFTKSDRMHLFCMMNELPSVFEVVTDQQEAQNSVVTTRNSNKSKSDSKMGIVSEYHGQKSTLESKDEDEDEDDLEMEEEDEDDETLCGACGNNYSSDEFWICCDICEKWFHGKCVKVTPTKAEHMKKYKCPACSSRRSRP